MCIEPYLHREFLFVSLSREIKEDSPVVPHLHSLHKVTTPLMDHVYNKIELELFHPLFLLQSKLHYIQKERHLSHLQTIFLLFPHHSQASTYHGNLVFERNHLLSSDLASRESKHLRGRARAVQFPLEKDLVLELLEVETNQYLIF